ncbi:MAG: polyketide cyclase [Hoeflea sp. BRH_c9]|nr:MAG: polyketide cyclase [Hoeflea sp. BRH_c9]
MTGTDSQTRSVIVERELAHPPEKIWRALTQSHLIGEWLMQTDFQLNEGHEFSFNADWGRIDCQVVTLEPNRMLAYNWVSQGLDSVVTWTLTPSETGTLLRMEQTGFHPGQRQALTGATAGWPRFLDKLEQLLAGTD